MNVKETVRLDNADMFIVIDARVSEKRSTTMHLYIKKTVIDAFWDAEKIILEGGSLGDFWGFTENDYRVNAIYVDGTNKEILEIAKGRLRNARDIIEKELNNRISLPKTTIRLSDL